jgi:type I restriction enzyme S subunit
MLCSRFIKPGSIANAQIEIQIVDTHESLKTRINSGFAACAAQLNRTLLTRNSKELVGKVGIVRSLPKEAIYNNNLMRLRLVAGAIPSFVCSQMCSDGFRRRMELVKKATTNVAAVYAKDLFPLPLALPPVEEQHRIVAEIDRRLSILRETETQVDANLQRAERMRQAILARVFSGVQAALN